MNRLSYLDTLRGFAALVVVFCHWQFFFFMGSARATFDVEKMAFYSVLHPLYNNAWMGVEFFFALSGFIFCWIYADKITSRNVSARKFALVRLARLYPLHLAMLLWVMIGQVWYRSITGEYFIFKINDAIHLVYNLLMVSSWGLEKGYSFNGPFWSVSVEIFLYIAFFTLCRLFRITYVLAGLMVLLGFFVGHYWYAPLGRGLMSFYVGCMACLVYKQLVKSGLSGKKVSVISAICAAGWIGYAVVVYNPGLLNIRGVPFVWRFQDVFSD